MNDLNTKKASQDAEPAQDWHPADVKAALAKAGYTLAALAEEHGLKGGATLSKALTSSFPIAEKRIADAIGVHPKVIWPSRYNEDGSRKLQGFRAIESSRRMAKAQAKAEGGGV
ncbi:MAG: helix-turn-helix transcriptional regulator [Methylobacter sp.]|nr:helix-turn-helix transcriptional regulator [Methylobacter sp.]